MFDFDGTVTDKGVNVPDQEMADLIVDLAQVMPVSFCTGRELSSFKKRALIPLLAEIAPEKKDSFLKNLFLIAENGAIGYDYSEQKGDFEEFYRVDWPEVLDRAELQKRLTEECKQLGEVFYKHHEVVVVTRAGLKPVGEIPIEKVYAYSAEIYDKTHEIMGELCPDYGQYFHIGNSGLGVLVCPAEGDKDHGIEMFGQILQRQRGMVFEKDYRDIFVVGDSPLPGGNDYHFLKGRLGTPYTVGAEVKNTDYPLVVKDEVGNILNNATGTKFLINSLLTNYN